MDERWWLNVILSLPDDKCNILEYSKKAKINNITLKKKLVEFEQKNIVKLCQSEKCLSALQIELTDKGRQFKNTAFQMANFLN